MFQREKLKNCANTRCSTPLLNAAVKLYMFEKSMLLKKKLRREQKKEQKRNEYYGNENLHTNDWFTDQYEKLIGKPLPRKELTTDEVLKRLQKSTRYRRIPEAKDYKSPEPNAGSVHYLEWRDPQINKCICPDADCTCKGNIMFPRKKIPRGERYFKSALCRKLAESFRKPAPSPPENFVQRLAAVVGVEAAVYKDLERRGVLNIRGAEFCISRCIRYYGPGHLLSTKRPLKTRKESWSENLTTPNATKEENNDELRICDGVSCTVSTQTTMGPEGEFIIGNYARVLYATLGNAIMRDIEGKQLHIESHKCVTNNSPPKYNLCSLNKLLNMREILNMKELKNQFSQLQQNIYSSIFKMNEQSKCPCPSSGITASTQYEEEDVNKRSSEEVTIETPYKGVIKIKKKPMNIEPHQEITQIQNENIHDMPAELKTNKANFDSKPSNHQDSHTFPKQQSSKQEKSKMKITANVELKKNDLTKTVKQEQSIENDNRTSNIKIDASNVSANFLFATRNNTLEESINKKSNTQIYADKNEIVSKDIEGTTTQKQSNNILHKNCSKVLKNKNIIINTSKEIHTKRKINFFHRRINELIHQRKTKKDKTAKQSHDSNIISNAEKAKEIGLQSIEKENHISNYGKEVPQIHSRFNEYAVCPAPDPNDTQAKLEHLSLEENKMSPKTNLKDSPITKNHADHPIKLDSFLNSKTESDKHGKQTISIYDQDKKIMETSFNDGTHVPSCQKHPLDTCKSKRQQKTEESDLTNLDDRKRSDHKFNNDRNDKLGKLSTYNERLQYDHQNIAQNLPTKSKDRVEGNLKGNKFKNKEIVKRLSITRKISKFSSMLKGVIRNKTNINNSLPGRFLKSFQESDLKLVGKGITKSLNIRLRRFNQEPKSSEKEVFSIQYSDLSEMKKSSKSLTDV